MVEKTKALDKGSREVVYTGDGGKEVKLSVNIVRQFLAPKASDHEAAYFIAYCRSHGLDPFRRDAFLVKYDQKTAAQVVTSHAYFLRRASRNPKYRGFQSGLCVSNSDTEGVIIDIEGGILPPGSILLGGWCKVFMHEYHEPVTMKLPLEEYNKSQATWRSMRNTMIIKCAEAHAHRKACPDELGGLYTEDEMRAAQGDGEKYAAPKPQHADNEVMDAEFADLEEELAEEEEENLSTHENEEAEEVDKE